MRIPDSLFFTRARAQLEGSRSAFAEAQSRALTGKRVQKPSDDPLAAAQAQRASFRGKRAEGHERTVNVALAALHVADDALQHVSDALERARQLALQAATDTQNADNRAAVAEEISQIREQVRSLANTRAGGRYVFSGYSDGTEAFDPTGAYQGHPEAAQLRVAPGVSLAMGVPGDQIFAPPAGADAFATLDALETALRTNDVTGIRGAVDGIDASAKQVVDARAELGGSFESAETALSVVQRIQDQSVAEQSKLTDADAIGAFSDLARAQQALEAAVQIAANLPPAGLLERS